MASGPQVDTNTDSTTQERSERAREILQLAEYLGARPARQSGTAPDALASPREWADEDPSLLARAQVTAMRHATFDPGRREAAALMARAAQGAYAPTNA